MFKTSSIVAASFYNFKQLSYIWRYIPWAKKASLTKEQKSKYARKF